MEALFWTLVAAVPCAYLAYPFFLSVAVAVLKKPVPAPGDARVAGCPRISVMVPAYNEAASLGERLQNLAALDYPKDRLEFIVGSDGSTDETAAIARGCGESRLRVVERPSRGGKTALLNEMMAASSGEIVVFTDANSRFDKNALSHLVAPFSNSRVGCVIGELVFANPGDPMVRAGEGLYWRLEGAVKEMEGRFGATIVATGAIYGIRRSLWTSLPPEASDDSLHPLLILSSGYDVVVAPQARAFEKAATSLAEEFHRKARMVTRQLAAYAQVGFFLRPLRAELAVRLFFHKIVRWLVPFFMLGALAANATLLHREIYRWTFVALLLGIFVLVVGALRLRRGRAVPALVRFGMYFLVVNAAAFVGVLDFLRGRRRIVWAVSRSTRT